MCSLIKISRNLKLHMITSILNANITYQIGKDLPLGELDKLKYLSNEKQVIGKLQEILQQKQKAF